MQLFDKVDGKVVPGRGRKRVLKLFFSSGGGPPAQGHEGAACPPSAVARKCP